jgi:hypothetical protein
MQIFHSLKKVNESGWIKLNLNYWGKARIFTAAAPEGELKLESQ